jgi:hypothetical protein
MKDTLILNRIVLETISNDDIMNILEYLNEEKIKEYI